MVDNPDEEDPSEDNPDPRSNTIMVAARSGDNNKNRKKAEKCQEENQIIVATTTIYEYEYGDSNRPAQ